jgi:hypothetical protein
MTFVDRLRHSWFEIRDIWSDDALAAHGPSLGAELRWAVWATYLVLSFVIGFRVRCFGQGCRERVSWDPIVGAYCDAHYPVRNG